MAVARRTVGTGAGGARAEKSAARREAILAAALDEFSARGFAAARLDAVAGARGGARIAPPRHRSRRDRGRRAGALSTAADRPRHRRDHLERPVRPFRAARCPRLDAGASRHSVRRGEAAVTALMAAWSV